MTNRIAFPLIVALLLAWSDVPAQDDVGRFVPKLQVGGFGSQVGGDGLSGFDKFNFGAGIGVSTALNESFHIEMELNFVQKGSKKRTDPDNYGEDQYKMDLWYLQIPILLEYRYNDKFGGAIGPAFGALVSSKETDFFGEIQDQPEFNTLDFSLVIGGRYYLSNRFMAELRLDQSLAPIRSKGSGVSTRLKGRQYNTVLGVFLSYYIR